MEIELQLINAVARQLKPLIPSAMKKECNGCFSDHPSQLQHECVMLEDEEERIRFVIDTALGMVQWKKVWNDFWKHLSVFHVLRCPRCFDDEDWLRRIFCDPDTKQKLIAALQSRNE